MPPRGRSSPLASAAAVLEAPAEREYLLIYGQPRVATDGAGIIYEVKRLRATHPGDGAAIRWAAGIASAETDLRREGKRYPAAPMVLRRGRTIVWEAAPRMALRVIG